MSGDLALVSTDAPADTPYFSSAPPMSPLFFSSPPSSPVLPGSPSSAQETSPASSKPEVERLLEQWGFSFLWEACAREGITEVDILTKLGADDLKCLGLTRMGDRIRFLDFCQKLSASPLSQNQSTGTPPALATEATAATQPPPQPPPQPPLSFVLTAPPSSPAPRIEMPDFLANNEMLAMAQSDYMAAQFVDYHRSHLLSNPSSSSPSSPSPSSPSPSSPSPSPSSPSPSPSSPSPSPSSPFSQQSVTPPSSASPTPPSPFTPSPSTSPIPPPSSSASPPPPPPVSPTPLISSSPQNHPPALPGGYVETLPPIQSAGYVDTAPPGVVPSGYVETLPPVTSSGHRETTASLAPSVTSETAPPVASSGYIETAAPPAASSAGYVETAPPVASSGYIETPAVLSGYVETLPPAASVGYVETAQPAAPQQRTPLLSSVQPANGYVESLPPIHSAGYVETSASPPASPQLQSVPRASSVSSVGAKELLLSAAPTPPLPPSESPTHYRSPPLSAPDRDSPASSLSRSFTDQGSRPEAAHPTLHRQSSSPNTGGYMSNMEICQRAIVLGETLYMIYNGGTCPLAPRPIRPVTFQKQNTVLQAIDLNSNMMKQFSWAKVVQLSREAPNLPKAVEEVTDFFYDLDEGVASAQECVENLSLSPNFVTLGLGKSVTDEQCIKIFADAILNRKLCIRKLVLCAIEQIRSIAMGRAVAACRTLQRLDTPNLYMNQEVVEQLSNWLFHSPSLRKLQIRGQMSRVSLENLESICEERKIRIVKENNTNFTQSTSHPVQLPSPVPSSRDFLSSSSTPTTLPETHRARVGSSSPSSSTSSSSSPSGPRSPSGLSLSSSSSSSSSSSISTSRHGYGGQQQQHQYSAGAVLQCHDDGKLRPVWIADASMYLDNSLNVQVSSIPVQKRIPGHFYHIAEIAFVPGKKVSSYRGKGASEELGAHWRLPEGLSNSPSTPAPPARESPAASTAATSSQSSSRLTGAEERVKSLSAVTRGVREIDFRELYLEPKPIGSGAFGVVHRGMWRGARVAVKKLILDGLLGDNADLLMAEFRSEIAVMNLIGDHPNVIRLIGVCSTLPNLCVVTPWMARGSLEDLLFKEKAQLPVKTLVRIAKEIAAGILHLHYDKIIHRDLALRNILIDDTFTAYVSDFGLSRLKTTEAVYARTESSVGPVKNMAPEAILERKYSEKSDAYSYGILLWQLFAREQPYPKMTPMEIVVYVVSHKNLPPLTMPPDTHPTLVELCAECLKTDPASRPGFQIICNSLTLLFEKL